MARKLKLAGLLLLAAALIGLNLPRDSASAQTSFSNSPQNSRWGQDYLPNVEVQDQDGKTYRFYDDLMKDKLVVINFIFTTCTDICPLTTARLAQVQERLGDIIGRDIFMYSISIDPEHDTPEQLKRHADAFHIAPGWKFLTGKPEDIAQIRFKLGERSKTRSEHRHELLLGDVKNGEWSRDSAFGDLDRVAYNIKALSPGLRNAPPATVSESSGGEMIVADRPGEALFIKACSGCHTVGKGDRVGPDLSGVTERRERLWLTQFISAPDRVRARKDPIALALADRFKAVRMPNLQLSEADAGDLIAYIDAQTYAVRSPDTATPHDHSSHAAAGEGLSEHEHSHMHHH